MGNAPQKQKRRKYIVVQDLQFDSCDYDSDYHDSVYYPLSSEQAGDPLQADLMQ